MVLNRTKRQAKQEECISCINFCYAVVVIKYRKSISEHYYIASENNNTEMEEVFVFRFFSSYFGEIRKGGG